MPAGRTRAAQPDAPERQIDVVRHHQEIARKVDLGLAQRRPQRTARTVHVAERLDEQHLADRLGPRHLENAGAVLDTTLAGQPPAVGQQVDHAEADVMAREPISLARIAQAADHLHPRPMVVGRQDQARSYASRSQPDQLAVQAGRVGDADSMRRHAGDRGEALGRLGARQVETDLELPGGGADLRELLPATQADVCLLRRQLDVVAEPPHEGDDGVVGRAQRFVPAGVLCWRRDPRATERRPPRPRAPRSRSGWRCRGPGRAPPSASPPLAPCFSSPDARTTSIHSAIERPSGPLDVGDLAGELLLDGRSSVPPSCHFPRLTDASTTSGRSTNPISIARVDSTNPPSPMLGGCEPRSSSSAEGSSAALQPPSSPIAARGSSLVERTAIGAGASGRNLGAIQHPFDPVLAPLYHESLTRYRALADAAGGFAIGASPGRAAPPQSRPRRRGRAGAPPAGGGPRAAALAPLSRRARAGRTIAASRARRPSGWRPATRSRPASATDAWARLAEERGARLLLGSAARPVVEGATVAGVTPGRRHADRRRCRPRGRGTVDAGAGRSDGRLGTDPGDLGCDAPAAARAAAPAPHRRGGRGRHDQPRRGRHRARRGPIRRGSRHRCSASPAPAASARSDRRSCPSSPTRADRAAAAAARRRVPAGHRGRGAHRAPPLRAAAIGGRPTVHRRVRRSRRPLRMRRARAVGHQHRPCVGRDGRPSHPRRHRTPAANRSSDPRGRPI